MSNEQLVFAIVGTAASVLTLWWRMYKHLDKKIDSTKSDLGKLGASINRMEGRFQGQDYSTLSTALNEIAAQGCTK